MNSSLSQHKIYPYSPTQSRFYPTSPNMHKNLSRSPNSHTSSYQKMPITQFRPVQINLTKEQIKIESKYVTNSSMMIRNDSINNMIHHRKQSIRCQHDYIQEGQRKENQMDISQDLRQQNQQQQQRFYQTEKTITNGILKDNKSSALLETSSTMKQINNITLNRKSSFYPTSKSKGKYLSRQQSKKNRISIFLDKKLDGDCFDIIKPIGRGKYGKVYLVREKVTGFILALKAVEKKKILQANLLEQFIRQIKIQFYLDHPGIIKLYGFFDDIENIYLLMELGCDGQLYDKISDNRLLTEQSASFIARELLETVDYMHHEKILHRDIKPENIVVIMGNLKICDFGWAVYNDTEMRSTFCGTPMYFSPELLSKQEYDQKVDLWAVGVLTYELVIGKSPFNLKQPKDLGRIVTHSVQFPRFQCLSPQFKQFIQKILQKDPDRRPTSKQLLNTKFIHKYNNLQICQQLCRPKIYKQILFTNTTTSTSTDSNNNNNKNRSRNGNGNRDKSHERVSNKSQKNNNIGK